MNRRSKCFIMEFDNVRCHTKTKDEEKKSSMLEKWIHHHRDDKHTHYSEVPAKDDAIKLHLCNELERSDRMMRQCMDVNLIYYPF